MSDIIWSENLDDGNFRAWVEITGETTAVLKVELAGHPEEPLLLDTPVSLAHATRVGSYMDDVASWQDAAVVAADEWYAEHGASPPA